MLRFPLFNHTIFYGVREILRVLYLTAQEGFTNIKHAQFPFSPFDQKIPFKTVERCINNAGIKAARSDQAFNRNGRFLNNKVIDHPVHILFFHLNPFLIVVNKGFVLML
jgi:hypothetical protein